MPYFPQNQPEYNYMRHMHLMQWDGPDSISTRDLMYYVAHMNEKGEPDDWFFDTLQVFSMHCPTGNALHNDINLGTTASGCGDFFAVPSPNPGRMLDWEATLDSIFARDGFIPRLSEAVDLAAGKIGPPKHPRNVVITVPYPSARQCAWGQIQKGGPKLNFTVINQNLIRANEQRLEACKWFVDETIARWERTQPKNLHLLGFYWVYESLHYSWDVDDHWVLKELYKYIRSRGSRMFWIPFYSSFNVNLLRDGKGFYFDCAFLQPNHMFYLNIPGVGKAANEAKERGAGVEMEYYMHIDPVVDLGKQRIPRLYNYLNGGIDYGYMTESACAYFTGFNDVHRIAQHSDDVERQVYHDMFHFVKGDYEKKEVSPPGE